MKRVLITSMALAVLIACNSGGEKTETKAEEKKEKEAQARRGDACFIQFDHQHASATRIWRTPACRNNNRQVDGFL